MVFFLFPYNFNLNNSDWKLVMKDDFLYALIVIVIALFFFPTILSAWKKQEEIFIVFIINVIGGWTFLGWCFALFMSLSGESRRSYKYHVVKKDIMSDPFVKSGGSPIELAIKKTKEKEKEIILLHRKKVISLNTMLPIGVLFNTLIFFGIGVFSGLFTSSAIDSIIRDDFISMIYGFVVFLIISLFPIFDKLVIFPELNEAKRSKIQAYKAAKRYYEDIIVRTLQKNCSSKLHRLGLMTVSDVRNKVSYLKNVSDTIIRKILDNEVYDKKMEKIPLNKPVNPGDNYIYKSKKYNIANLARCETIHIEID